jgi:FdhD protein
MACAPEWLAAMAGLGISNPAIGVRTVERWQGGAVVSTPDQLAEEVPVALVYSGIPYVVMLTTPQDLEDFAVGFSLSEQVVAAREEVRSINIRERAPGVQIELCIPRERLLALADRQRNLAGRTGCGLCGTQHLDEAIRHPARTADGAWQLSAEELHARLHELPRWQTLNAATGALHAAAWVRPGEGISLVREDIGRHNALDKLIGALAGTARDFSSGYAIVTSRASYEMVQKAATVGIPMLVAVSAPTVLATRIAEEAGVTLVGFARQNTHVVYTHPHRFQSTINSNTRCISNVW